MRSLYRWLPFEAFLIFSIFFSWSPVLFADEPDFRDTADYEKVFLYRIIVSPLRAPQELIHTPQNVALLDKEDLKNLPVSDPAEALTYISGVDVSSRTRFGHFTPLSIQGSESRHVLVMVDGIPFNTQASGQADILAALPLNNLERIEVIKGSASSAWGSSLGGVINLITKTPSHSVIPKGHVTSAWAGFRTKEHSFDTTGSAGPLDYFVSGDYQEAGGSRIKGGTQNRDDTLQKKWFGKLVYLVSDILKATFSAGYSDADVNEGVYASDGTRLHVPYAARYGLLRFDLDLDERNHWEATLKSNRQLISTDSLDGVSENLLSNVRTQDNYYGVELKNVIQFRTEDTLVLGGDVSDHILKSSQLSRSKGILFGAPYANYTMVAQPFDVIAGMRYDLNEEFGDQWNPSLGAVYHVPGVPDTLVRANISRSFSAPPVLWKFFEDISPGVTANNPDLKPERAWTYEGSVETHPCQPLWLKVNFFRSDIDDAINTVERQDGLFIKKNFEKFRQQGFEFESRLALIKKLFVLFSANFNDVENRVTGLTVRNRGVTRPGFRVGLEGEGLDGVRLHVDGRYQRWDSSPGVQPNDRKFILDGKISKQLTTIRGVGVTCFLSVYNLTNSKYWSDRDFPLPQRYFEGGVTLEF